GADLVVRHHLDAPGQVALAAGDGAQGVDHPAHVAHDVGGDPPGAAAHQGDQQKAETDPKAGGGGVVVAGGGQRLLEVHVGAVAKGRGQGLGALELAGQALQVVGQVAERGRAVDQPARDVEGV